MKEVGPSAGQLGAGRIMSMADGQTPCLGCIHDRDYHPRDLQPPESPHSLLLETTICFVFRATVSGR